MPGRWYKTKIFYSLNQQQMKMPGMKRGEQELSGHKSIKNNLEGKIRRKIRPKKKPKPKEIWSQWKLTRETQTEQK